MTEGEFFVLQDDGYFILRKGVVIFGECMLWGMLTNLSNHYGSHNISYRCIPYTANIPGLPFNVSSCVLILSSIS